MGIVCAPTYSYCNATKCALSIVFSIYRNAINKMMWNYLRKSCAIKVNIMHLYEAHAL